MAEQWITELGALPHNQRVKRSVELGRASVASPQAAALLAELAAARPSNLLAQQALLYSAYGSRELDPLHKALAGSSKSLRELAASILADLAPADQLPQVRWPHVRRSLPAKQQRVAAPS